MNTRISRPRSMVRLSMLMMLYPSNLPANHLEFIAPNTGPTGIACSGSDYYEASSYSGTVLKQFRSVVYYSIDPAGSPDLTTDQLKAAVDAAFSTWQTASGGTLSFSFIPWSSPPPCTSDRIVRLTWSTDPAKMPNGANAFTQRNYDRATGEIVSSQIVFNQTKIFGNTVVWRTDGATTPCFYEL